jgi:hypothetical protein
LVSKPPGEKESQDEVKKFQKALHLQATGKFYQKLFDNIRVLPRGVIRNASMMDVDILEKVLQLQLTKLNSDQVALIMKGMPSESPTSHKAVEGQVADITGVRAVNLGQINSKTTIYGMIDPEDKKIFDVMAAPIKTIKKTKMESSDLHEPS